MAYFSAPEESAGAAWESVVAVGSDMVPANQFNNHWSTQRRRLFGVLTLTVLEF